MVNLDSSSQSRDSTLSPQSSHDREDLSDFSIGVTAYRQDMLRLFDASESSETLDLESMLEDGITYASLHYLLAGAPNREEIITRYANTRQLNDYDGILFSRVSWEKVSAISVFPGSIYSGEQLDKELESLISSSEFLSSAFIPKDVIQLIEDQVRDTLIEQVRFVLDSTEMEADTVMKVSLNPFPEPISLVSLADNERSKKFLRHLQAYQDFKRADVSIDPDDILMSESGEISQKIAMCIARDNIKLEKEQDRVL